MTYSDYLLYVKIVLKNNDLVCNEAEELYSTNLEMEVNNKTSNNIHDKCFRNILSDKNEMINFLKDFINYENTIKLQEIEAYNSSFITSKYQNREADIVYKIKGKNAFILIEHQSKIDKKMPFRLMEYYTEILRRTNIKKIDKMPIVIPIIIYTGDKKWSSNGLISEQQENVEGYNTGRLDIKYNLIQSRKYSVKELLNKGTMLSIAMIIENSKGKIELIKNLEKIVENTNEKEKLKNIINVMLVEILEKADIEKIEKMIEKKEENYMNPLAERIKRNERREKIKVMEKTKLNIAKKLVNLHIPLEQIIQVTGLSEKKIKNI